MTTPYDVPVTKFIQKLASYLKNNVDEIKPPTWANIVKTGAHVQKPPQNPDWWYIRCASLLRKIYTHGPIGVQKLRAEYGGRKDFGVHREHAAKAGGAVIRKALQELETAGLVEEQKAYGKRLTPKGRKLLHDIAEEVGKELLKEKPELARYQKGE